MGAADTVPGVSGGTIAFISGIYEELISSIGEINTSLVSLWKTEGFIAVWKKVNGNFLVSILAGIIFSVFTFMRLTNYLLKNEPILVWSFFFGLVLASIWFVGKQIEKWKFATVLALLLSAGLAYFITTLPALASQTSLWYLFICGALAICAMILPGISGAFILVLLGAYQEITQAVHDFNFKKVGIVALGAIIGLLSFSKILKWLFGHYKNITLAALTGFIAGSLAKIWPWKKILNTTIIDGKTITLDEKMVWPWNFEGEAHLLLAIILLVVGFLLILVLEQFGQKDAR